MSGEPDVLDQASNLTEQLTTGYVNHVRNRMRPEQVRNADGTWPHPNCVDCEIDIPPARLEMGRIRCVNCQEDEERAQRRAR